ncbi:hypothetical protein ACIBUY_28085 [Streptomyces sp. NPDC050085]
MAGLVAGVISRAVGWLGRLAGLLLIAAISGAVGFVLGVTISSAPPIP